MGLKASLLIHPKIPTIYNSRKAFLRQQMQVHLLDDLGSRNPGTRAAPCRVEPRLEGEAELVAADEDGAAAELAQEAQHGEVVVGLDGVPHDGAEPPERLAVGFEVAEDLRLAVEVERAPRRRRHRVLHPHPLAVQVPVGAAAEAVLRGRRRRGCRLRRWGWGGRGDGGAHGGQAGMAAREGNGGGGWATAEARVPGWVRV